jgi:hypothetical protein
MQYQRSRLNIQCSNKALPAMTVQTLHLVGNALVNLILAIRGPSCVSVKKNLSAAAVRYPKIVRPGGPCEKYVSAVGLSALRRTSRPTFRNSETFDLVRSTYIVRS